MFASRRSQYSVSSHSNEFGFLTLLHIISYQGPLVRLRTWLQLQSDLKNFCREVETQLAVPCSLGVILSQGRGQMEIDVIDRRTWKGKSLQLELCEPLCYISRNDPQARTIAIFFLNKHISLFRGLARIYLGNFSYGLVCGLTCDHSQMVNNTRQSTMVSFMCLVLWQGP